MPETYNPQERTFIRRPEPKVCITCGQPLPSDVKPLTNHMNNYINDLSGRVVTMNSNEPFVEVQGVKLRRSDIPKETPPAYSGATIESPVAKTTSPILTQPSGPVPASGPIGGVSTSSAPVKPTPVNK